MNAFEPALRPFKVEPTLLQKPAIWEVPSFMRAMDMRAAFFLAWMLTPWR
jgi:hypothetical protein